MRYFTIGRFQPPHAGHYSLLEKICAVAGSDGEEVLIGILDTGVRSCANPLSYEERVSVMEDFGLDVDFFPLNVTGPVSYIDALRNVWNRVPDGSIFCSGDTKDILLAKMSGYDSKKIYAVISTRASPIRRKFIENDPSWTDGLVKDTENKISTFFRDSGFSGGCLKKRGLLLKY